jgi:catechol 2,3-dioxygenase-like lactoylglutathione lyase family enzyme
MSTTDVSGETSAASPDTLGVDMNLEAVTVPVADVDRAKAFYESLGWRMDIDLVVSDEVRTVQMTPPHSGCSIHIGTGLTEMEPGSLDRVLLAVKDIEAARTDLISRGIEVSEVANRKPPGFDAPGTSYFLYASFQDPDGNGWLMQEITTRLPGRTWED